jgi:hypothetical protein
LGTRSDPKPLFAPEVGVYDWKNAHLEWSFDEKQILLTFIATIGKETVTTSAYLINVDNPDDFPINVTASVENQRLLWQTQKKEKERLDLESIPASLSAILHSSTDMISWAPDETKIFYHATGSATIAPIITPPIIGSNPTEETRKIMPNQYYVFDLKEDKNFFIGNDMKNPKGSQITGWYSDSKHLILIENNTIYFVDYDGTNKRSVYSGPFIDSIVYPWATGGQIVILTNFNNPNSSPNFYEIDLR